MFTGIVEEVGTVEAIQKGAHSCKLTVRASLVLADVHVGDSIATNGVCLTVTSFTPSSFTADVMHETLNRSSLGELRHGSPVNLERAMLAGGRFGGHIVSGHIDGVGAVQSIKEDDNAIWYTIQAPKEIMAFVIQKGSIAIDGISLTVAGVTASTFSVSVIPHTRAQTNLLSKKPGSIVNLENDCIGKYVAHLMRLPSELLESAEVPELSLGNGRTAQATTGQGITEDFLRQHGF